MKPLRNFMLERACLGSRLITWASAALLLAATPCPCFCETDTGTPSATAGGMKFTAGTDGAKDVETSNEYGNAGDGDLGGTDLNNGQEVWSGDYNLLDAGDSYGNENLGASWNIQSGVSGGAQMGSNGVQASGEIGLEVQLDALAKFAVGDENFGGGGAAEAQVQALLKAQGSIGAYIDSKGLTIGVEAKAEAMVSADLTLSLNLTLFGVATTVQATAHAQAGASASAEATVTIGFDGLIHFKLGAGATAGVGAGLNFEFEVSAPQLMESLGIKDLSQLIEWCQKFVENPDELAKDLAKEAGKELAGALADQVKDEALAAAKDLAGSAWDLADNVLGSAGSLPGGGGGGILGNIGSGLQGLFGGGGSPSGPGNSGIGGGGGGGGGGSSGGGGSDGSGYTRDEQFKQWSK